MSEKPDTPVSITSARRSHSEDIHRRTVRYLLSMAVRTACFLLAIVTTGPLRWSLVGAAFILPYVAVVIANTSDGRDGDGPDSFEPEPLPRLDTGPVDDRLGRTLPPRAS